MEVTAELTERFFDKQCTAGEAKHVAAYLKTHPAELDKYLDVSEWNDAEINGSMPGSPCRELWQSIESERKTFALRVWLKKSAVAAGIAGVICMGYYNFQYSNKGTVAKASITADNNSITVTKTAYKIIQNNLKQVIKTILPDSSVIRLYPGAVIQYEEPFQNNRRDIYLTGKALFNVAKNREKPFTVYSGSLSTTALGTIFSITTGKNPSDNVRIKLFRGKVVIKSTYALKGWNKDVYLLPGQQMRYNADKMLVAVDNITTIKAVIKPPAKQILPVADNRLEFSGAALPDVIEQLSTYFSAKIQFNKAEIEAMNFTGTINKKDSLSNVLKLIGQMNDLEILQKNDTLILQKIIKQQ